MDGQEAENLVVVGYCQKGRNLLSVNTFQHPFDLIIAKCGSDFQGGHGASGLYGAPEKAILIVCECAGESEVLAC